MRRLFIYGTLKRDQSQHHRLAGQCFVGEAATLPEFRLLDLGWYPGLARTPHDGQAIVGEVWEIGAVCLQTLDAYEGDEYERRAIGVVMDGRRIVAEAYVLHTPDWSRPDAGVSWG